MNSNRLITILLTKSYALGLITILVGCIPATTPSLTPIDTSTFSRTSIAVSGFSIVNGPHENEDALLDKVGQDEVLVEEYDFSYVTSLVQNSEPDGLPNSGGGGSGGRRRTLEMK